MPADPKPLFRPDAVRPKLTGFALPPTATATRAKLGKWATLLGSKAGGGKKETELRDEFLYDVFRDLLGYTTPTQSPGAYTFKKEAAVQADGTFADAAFGRFNGHPGRFTAVMEGKGPGDPLDRPYGGRKLSAVQQALQYAVQLRTDWYLVTNLRETRLYHKGHDTLTYERFDTARLAADDTHVMCVRSARSYFFLGRQT
jgi:hypothetical protein